MKISEAYDLYKLHVIRDRGMKPATEENYKGAVKSLTDLVGDLFVEYLGIDHIFLWKQDMRDRGLQATSINTNLAKIRQILKFMKENEVRVLDYTKITRVKEVQRPHTVVTPQEVRLLMEHTKNVRDKALIAIYYGTGCRLSEILNLDKEAFINAEEVGVGIYKIWVCGKGDKYRPVNFTERTKAYVDDYLETRHDYFKPLFMSNQNNRLGKSAVERMIHDVTRRAGLDKKVTPHVFRHSYTTDMAGNGAPIASISKLLGHKNTSTTLNIYTHIDSVQSENAFANHHTDV